MPEKKLITAYEYVNAQEPFYINYRESTPLNWKLGKEKKVVNGLTCHKANIELYGRKWTAWYSVEIPVSFGPYKFYGLPGLIVSIYDDTETHRFDLEAIGKKPRIFPKAKFSSPTYAAKEKARALVEKARFGLDTWNNVISVDGDVNFRAKLQKSADERKKKYNNPIEREN